MLEIENLTFTRTSGFELHVPTWQAPAGEVRAVLGRQQRGQDRGVRGKRRGSVGKGLFEQNAVGREPKRQRERSLLTLRCVGPGREVTERQHDFVAVRTDRGHAASNIEFAVRREGVGEWSVP